RRHAVPLAVTNRERTGRLVPRAVPLARHPSRRTGLRAGLRRRLGKPIPAQAQKKGRDPEIALPACPGAVPAPPSAWHDLRADSAQMRYCTCSRNRNHSTCWPTAWMNRRLGLAVAATQIATRRSEVFGSIFETWPWPGAPLPNRTV